MRKDIISFALLVLCAFARRRRPHVRLGDTDDDMLPEPLKESVLMEPETPDHSDPLQDIPDLSRFRPSYDIIPNFATNYSSAPRGIFDSARTSGRKMSAAESSRRAHMWFDFVSMHDRNVQRPLDLELNKQTEIASKPKAFEEPSPKVPDNHNAEYFSPHSFTLKENDTKPDNWTTCDEMRRKTKYNPADIVGKKWIPFYIWAGDFGKRAFVHVFQYATVVAVKYYYTKFKKNLNNTINWMESKLIMIDGDTESLLISGDGSGLYYMIPNVDLPEHVIKDGIIVPLIPVRLKIHGSYLLFMHCSFNFAYIMAELGEEPQTKEDKKHEAEASGFRGEGRAISRNIKYEKSLIEERRQMARLREARNFLPINPNFGLFPPELSDLEPSKREKYDEDDE